MDVKLEESHGVRLAIEGCGHGTLHAIYASIEEACTQKGWPGIDLLIIGGDFQSVRNAYDLNCVSMPAKYREMGDFHEYYSGQRVAPCLTVFVGGNHEASNYLFELYYGGWVAPNIYYMGAANVLKLGPLRIAGLSGIWKGFDYRKPHFERLPYNESDLRSIYHVREMDARKLLQIRTQVDIGISHDWPQGIEWKGDWKKLFRIKKGFEEDARSGKLGSIAAKQVLERLRPKYWFSAHLHCKYPAVVSHGSGKIPLKALPESSGLAPTKTNGDEIDLEEAVNGTGNAAVAKNDDEIDLDLDDDEPSAPVTEEPLGLHTAPATAITTAPQNADEIDLELEDDNADATRQSHTQPPNGAADTSSSKDASNELAEARAALPASFARPKAPEPIVHPPEITNQETSFLALDKCIPNRDFLQLTSVPVEAEIDQLRPLKLAYDREWLAITRAFALTESVPFGDPNARVPYAKTQSEYCDLIADQRKWVDENLTESDLIVPENFQIQSPVYDGGDFRHSQYQQVWECLDPQTAQYCQLLQIANALDISEEERKERMATGPRPEPEMHFGGGRGRGGFDRGRGTGGRVGRRGRGRGFGRGRGRGRG